MATQAAARRRATRTTCSGCCSCSRSATASSGSTARRSPSFAPFIVKDLGLTNAQVGWTASALSLAIALSLLLRQPARRPVGQAQDWCWSPAPSCSRCFRASAGWPRASSCCWRPRFPLGATEEPDRADQPDHDPPDQQPQMARLQHGLHADGRRLRDRRLHRAAWSRPSWARAHGWRTAMFLSVIPGLIVAALMVFLIKPDAKAAAGAGEAAAALLDRFRGAAENPQHAGLARDRRADHRLAGAQQAPSSLLFLTASEGPRADHRRVGDRHGRLGRLRRRDRLPDPERPDRAQAGAAARLARRDARARSRCWCCRATRCRSRSPCCSAGCRSASRRSIARPCRAKRQLRAGRPPRSACRWGLPNCSAGPAARPSPGARPTPSGSRRSSTSASALRCCRLSRHCSSRKPRRAKSARPGELRPCGKCASPRPGDFDNHRVQDQPFRGRAADRRRWAPK